MGLYGLFLFYPFLESEVKRAFLPDLRGRSILPAFYMRKIRTRKRGAKWYFSFEAGKKPDGKRNIIEKRGIC